METIRYLFFGALLLLTGSFSLNAQVNWIPNGNFEQVAADGSITSWGDDYNDYWDGATTKGTITADNVVFKEGNQSAYFENANTKAALNWIANVPGTTIPGNKTYDISFWFRSNASVKDDVQPTVSLQGTMFTGGDSFSMYDYENKIGVLRDAVVGEWVFVEIKGIQFPEMGGDLIFSIASNYEGFWIDDVKMVEASGTKSAQTITSIADITKQLGDADFDLSAKTSSYLPVTYSIADASIATITRGKVHLLKVGSTTITASQAGDNAYEAANKTVTLTVTEPPVAAIEIPNGNFEQVDADGIPTNWGGSADNVIFKEGKQSGYFTGRSTSNSIKYFPGNKAYDISFWFRTIASIKNGVIPEISLSGTYFSTYGAGAVLSQDAIDKLNVRHEAVAGEWLFVEAKGIKLPEGTGSLYLNFQSNYDGMWLDDARIVESGTTTKTAQTITFTDITKKTGDADFALSATASSNLPVSYSIADASIATITNGTVHILKAGTTTITASQAGNGTYAAAPDVTATLTISTVNGISEVRTQLPVRIQNGNVIVTAQSGSQLEVFNVLGLKLHSQIANSTETTFSNLPQGQVLIVRSGNAVAKVIL